MAKNMSIFKVIFYIAWINDEIKIKISILVKDRYSFYVSS